MPSPSHSLINYLRVVVGAWRDDPRDDAALIARFAEGGDEAAFRVLVWRHGPLVWRTCRSILGDTPDAEDAFQSAFLALARKAGRFPVESLAGWLHRVARQVAMDVRSKTRRNQNLERRLHTISKPELEANPGRTELYAVMDEELAGLPERLRIPLVLRYLEGKTLEDVAHIVGCCRRVLGKRLARGEAILRQRLEQRGLELGTVVTLLTSSVAISALPSRLIGSTARAAVAFRSGTLTGGAAEVARAVLETLPSSLGTTIMRKSLGVVLACCLGLGGAVLVTWRALSARPDEPGEVSPAAAQGPSQPGPGDRAVARVDCFDDPLPVHALARMGTVRQWYGRILYIPEHANLAFLAFSPDGKTLVSQKGARSCCGEHICCLWEAATGREIRRLTKKPVYRLNNQGVKVRVDENIVSLGFSPDGKTLIATLVAADCRLTVCQWEVATGKFLRKQEYQGLKRDNLEFFKIALLPDGKILGFRKCLKSVDEKGKGVRGAHVWDVTTGKEICQLSRPLKEGEGGHQTAFSPDGKMLVTVTNEENVNKAKALISLWDVATGKEIRQLTHEDGNVDMVTFSPGGKTLAAGGNRFGAICMWDVAAGKPIHRFKARGSGSAWPLTYSPDGKTLLGGWEGHLWDMATGKEIRSFDWKDTKLAVFSPSGKIVAMGDKAGVIRLWETATGKEILPHKGHQDRINSITYSPDGKTLASVSLDKTVRLWEAATGKEMRQLARHTEWTEGGSDSLAYSPDGKILVSMDQEVIHLWDTATGKEIRQFKGPTKPQSVIFSPDGKLLAATLGSGTVCCLWQVATGKQIYTREVPHSYGYGSAAFSPDGRMLAAPGKDNTVYLWEVATGKSIGQLLPKRDGAVVSLAFSPDGKILATSSERSAYGDLPNDDKDDKIRLWEVASGKEIGQLGWQVNGRKYRPRGYTLGFSPDGRVLATAAQGSDKFDGSVDTKVYLWEVTTGKEIGQLAGHRSFVRCVAFSPDGKTLASGSEDLTCLIWDVTPFGSRLKPAPARSLSAQALSQERLEAAWADLARDPAQAYATIRALQAVPTQAISLLRERVRAVAPVADPQQLKRWIADLDANNFTVRDKAQQEIAKLREAALPALRQALQGQPTLEVKRRLQDLVAELEPKAVGGPPERMRELRAVQVLESIGTTEARQVLQALVKGVAGARLTQEAEAALARLAKRSVARP